jgi:hypothetical protein
LELASELFGTLGMEKLCGQIIALKVRYKNNEDTKDTQYPENYNVTKNKVIASLIGIF